MTPIRRLALVALAATLLFALVAGCSDSDSAEDADADTSTDGSTPAAATDEDLGRVVALGEEFLLADLLALGITPVSSTVSVYDVPFQGLDDHDTSGIEPLEPLEPNLELLAAQDADTIVVAEFADDALGHEQVEALAEEVVVVPDGLSGEDQITLLGEAFGLEDEAGELVAAEQDALEAASEQVPEDCEVSVATIYGGPTPAVWVGGETAVPAAIADVGCSFTPSADDVDADQIGRFYLSLEQLGMLDAPTLVLVLVQTSSVEGEDASLAEIEGLPLWQQLPAIEAGAVVELDRFGYPGIEGRTRLYGDVAEALG